MINLKKLVILILLSVGAISFSYALLNNTSVKAALSGGVTEKGKTYPRIIIDAGHGGFDGGATDENGTPEKDINLAISLYLRDYLEFFGFHTLMTRTEDKSLEDDGLTTVKSKKTSDIHNRLKLMNDTDNCIFVSVHQNHYTEEKYSGAQVFYSGCKSESSSLLAQSIQNSIVEKLQPDNTRQIKPCPTSVYLIYNATAPAVLVECGFLSNTKEAGLLNTAQYQKQMAFSIAVGISDYCAKEISENGS